METVPIKEAMVRIIISTILLIGLLLSTAQAEEKIIYGTVTNIKTSKPYPFVSPQSGNIHECKVKIGYFEYDEEEQELEYYTYKAYPINGRREYCSKSLLGQRVEVKVEYNIKSPRRGEIQSLVVVH